MVPPDQFPVFKLVTLVARQMSSPIAMRIKTYAKNHPRFSEVMCMRTGRLYKNLELRYKMWLLQLRNPMRAPPVSDQVAMELGADILGEMVIFILGSCILIFEVNRQAMKHEVLKSDRRSQWVAILESLEELKIEVEIQQTELQRLRVKLQQIQTARFASTPSPSPSLPSQKLK